jgi:hypothetical protein
MSRAWILVALAGCKLASGGTFTSGEPMDTRSKPGDTSDERAERRKFVSTKASAAKLNGLPGMPCAAADAFEDGRPCWDPPGGRRSAPMAHLKPGMREMRKADWKSFAPQAIYWYEMPAEATLSRELWPEVPSTDGSTIPYEPYAPQGFERPKLPAFKGMTVQKVLATFAAFELPFSVTLTYKGADECEGPHDTVCREPTITDGNANIDLVVAYRIRYRGLANEQRLVPDNLIDRNTDEVVAELKAIGFTNIDVQARDLPCKRGIVCQMPGRPGWHETTKPLELWVRK